MTVTAVCDEVFGFVESVFEVLGFVHCENGGEFLVCEFFGQVDAGNFADEDFGFGGNGYACELRDHFLRDFCLFHRASG